MKASLCLALLAVPVRGTPGTDDLWAEFVRTFNKNYGTPEEENFRKATFLANMEKIESLNAKQNDLEYSHLSPFGDWTSTEFAQMHSTRVHSHLMSEQPGPLLDTSNLPEEFDWRTKGGVNEVQNQGKCGSCWAFSTVANIEGQNFVNGTKTLVKLSEQQLVDCSKATGNEGCKDGYPKDAFQDMVSSKYGLETEAAYPYQGQDGKCVAEASKESVFIDSWITISTDEDQIAAALMKYGVLSSAINAGVDGMMFYKKGISQPKEFECPANRINHGVNLVGWGVEKGTKYWTVRNTWGKEWGEDGYYRIIKGACGKPNAHYQCCGLNTMVTTALVRQSTETETVVV